MNIMITLYRKICNTVGRLGADIRYTQSKKKMNLLMLACKKSNLSIVEKLFKVLEEEKYQRDSQNKNIIHYTIEHQQENTSILILQFLLEQEPLLVQSTSIKKEIFKYQSKQIILHIISNHKTQIFKYLIQQQILEIDHQNILILHEIVKQHKKHKNKSITFMFLKILLFRGYPENIVNKQGQNYKDYAFNKRYISKYEMQEILEEIYKEMNQRTTSQTSRASKIIDNHSFLEFSQVEGEEENQSDSQEDEVIKEVSQSWEETQKSFNQEKHKNLSQEIINYGLKMYEDYKNVSLKITPFVQKVQKIVNSLYGTLQIIGSFACNLWIQKSDIDILVVFSNDQNLNLFNELIQHFYNKVVNIHQYSFIRLYHNAFNLPMIKIILSQKYNKQEIQIFISNKTSKASKYVIYINNIILQYPQIQYIYYFLRKILSLKELHDHKKGGLKAYALFLLVVSIRQKYNYSYISEYVECFCYYYGLFYDYPIQINQINGQIDVKLNIVDPLNYLNNMGGKKTNILAFQQLLKKVYYAININCLGDKLSFIFDIIMEI